MITSQNAPSLLAALPDWYAQVQDYQDLCAAEQPTFDAVQAAAMQVLNNFFFQTMDANACSQWEQALNILANPGTETLDFRRNRLLNRVSTKPPFTLQFLYNKLDELIGPGLWSVSVDYANYTLYIESSAQTQNYSQEVEFTINRIKPAHIVYVHQAVAASPILIGEQIEYTRFEWNYKLGSWQLGALPFGQVLENEVVKTPNQPSIQPALLNALTTYTADDIASALVNGGIAITNLTKTISGSTLTITYPISSSQTTEITQLALLAADGTVLLDAPVYIPVVDTVSAKHTIPIQEGGTIANASQ